MTWLSTSLLCLRFQMQMYWTFYAAGTSRSAPMYFQGERRMIAVSFNHFFRPPSIARLGHVFVCYSKKHSPGTVRYLGSYNQCRWARRCYKFYSPATSCLRSVCTLARGQYAPHFHSALPIYHHHHDLRVPSVHAIFLFRSCACLHAGPTLRFVMLCAHKVCSAPTPRPADCGRFYDEKLWNLHWRRVHLLGV